MTFSHAGRTKRSPSSLAINGGEPAFTEPLHVGRPNVGERDLFLKLVGEVLDRVWLTNDGPLVREFEQQIADYLGVRNCVAMCNGTIALETTIRALGLTGEVIVPSFTFVATAHSLQWQGITPVFADINPVTHTLDPEAVRRMITPRTTGIIGVHLWGQAAEIEALQAVADEHGLELMFDAAHAFHSSYHGRMIGGFGRAEVLSFHATKFFNTFEGGAVVTNDDELADALRLMRNFGFSGYDNVIYPGVNGKMIEVCAAMGLTNFHRIEEIVEVNKTNYLRYSDVLNTLPGLSLVPVSETEKSNYQYVVLTLGEECHVSRDELVDTLHAENVLARKYFWPGCHKMSPYRELFPHAGLMLPVTERVADQVIVLPTGTSVSAGDIEVIGSIIRERVAGK